MTWPKTLLVVVGVPVAALMLFVGWVWVSFSGGLDDVLDYGHPQEGDEDVVAAERRAREDIDGATADVEASLRRALAPATADVVGGGLEKPDCRQGQHNFKIDDEFDLLCELTSVQVVSAPAAPDVPGAEVAVDEALRSAGWISAGPGGDLRRYTGDLPPRRYYRSDDGVRWRLLVDEADLSAMTVELSSTDSGLRDASGRPTTVEDIIGRAPREGYSVVVALTAEYFRE